MKFKYICLSFLSLGPDVIFRLTTFLFHWSVEKICNWNIIAADSLLCLRPENTKVSQGGALSALYLYKNWKKKVSKHRIDPEELAAYMVYQHCKLHSGFLNSIPNGFQMESATSYV